ncbi:MAG: ChaN family lipoprotein [Bacteroidia bacterium]|nr:ChaN family lipoprotein [Bacteroidia bacterium]
MIKKLKLATVALVLSTVVNAQGTGKDPYLLYTDAGKNATYQDLLKKAKEADIVLFGELHDNPICHWLQLELTKDLYADKKEKLVLGAEMFEADDQIAITEYLKGKISEKTLKDEVKLWNNFATDYKPLLDFAKTNKLNFVATNIPRRYANMVYSKGITALDSVDMQAKQWIAPLPMPYDANLKCYKDIFENAGGHGGENLPKSQAIKDATMAHFILKNYSKGQTFLHYHGAYHSNNHQAIEWYLKQSNPNLKIMVIASAEQKDISKLEDANKMIGDFIICTPSNLTKTYK